MITNRWTVLALMFFVGLTVPLQFQSVPALASYLTTETNMNYTDIGVLTGLFMASGIFLAAPTGVLATRIGDRLSLIAGLLLMAASGILFASTKSFEVMVASRLLGGAGAVAVTVLMPKVITDWFAGKEIATAMAIIASSFGFGVGVAMAVLPYVATMASWQVAMLVNILPLAVTLVFLIAFFQDRTDAKENPANHQKGWTINNRELALSSLAGIGRGLFSSGYVVFMAFLPTLLVAQGLEVTNAGLLTSIAALVSLVSVPLGGYLSDVTGRPNYFIVGGSIGTALTCILVPYIAPAILWIVLFGVLRGGCTGGIMALPSQVLEPDNRATGFAVVSVMHFVCMAAFPAIAGYLLEQTADPAVPLWFAGCIWLAITLTLGIFKLLQHKWTS